MKGYKPNNRKPEPSYFEQLFILISLACLFVFIGGMILQFMGKW